VKDGGSEGEDTRGEEDWGQRGERTRRTKEDAWTRRRREVDEERRMDLMDQHQCEASEDEMWVETRSKG